MAGASLTIDGAPAALRADWRDVPPWPSLVAGARIRIDAVADRVDREGRGALVYRNRYRPLASAYRASFHVSSGAGWTYPPRCCSVMCGNLGSCNRR